LDQITSNPYRGRAPRRESLEIEDLTPIRLPYESNAHIELVDFWILLHDTFWLIVVATATAGGVTLLLSLFVLTKWYQSTALLRPIPDSMQGMSLEGYIGGFGGLSGGLLGALGEDEDEKQAREYISILESYAFTMDLMRRYNLVDRMRTEHEHSLMAWILSHLPGSHATTTWTLYEEMDGRFDASFSTTTGNITLTYLDKDPAQAQLIESYYIQSLRDILKTRVMNAALAAKSALFDDVAKTSDPIVRERLYDMIGSQLRRANEAKAQADFSFKVIDPPVVPDKPHMPKPLLFTAIAVVCTPMLLIALLRIGRSVSTLRREASAQAARLRMARPKQTQP
jgi:hypothetical protein